MKPPILLHFGSYLVVLICENNEYAISVHVDKSISVKNISTRAVSLWFSGRER